jgi:hypothetical protein
LQRDIRIIIVMGRKEMNSLLLDAHHHNAASEDVVQMDTTPLMWPACFFPTDRQHCIMILGISKLLFLLQKESASLLVVCGALRTLPRAAGGPWPCFVAAPVLLPVCIMYGMYVWCPSQHEKVERQQRRLAKKATSVCVTNVNPPLGQGRARVPLLAYISYSTHHLPRHSFAASKRGSPEQQGRTAAAFILLIAAGTETPWPAWWGKPSSTDDCHAGGLRGNGSFLLA